MKNYFLAGLLSLFLLLPSSSFATTVTFSPAPADLYDLAHSNSYTWGINYQVPTNQLITSAVLYIDHINDFIEEENDFLYIHLLDTVEVGVTQYSDDQGGGDYFLGQGPLVATYSDTESPYGNNQPTGDYLAYDFGTLGLLDDLSLFLGDNNFGFGFDPDCHFYNDGVKFELTLAPVPEPASMFLLGTGLIGLGGVARRKFKK